MKRSELGQRALFPVPDILARVQKEAQPSWGCWDFPLAWA